MSERVTRGGSRPGIGRKPMPEYLKRVRLRGEFRIPTWLRDWLLVQGKGGRIIEQALIDKFGLKPPDEKDKANDT